MDFIPIAFQIQRRKYRNAFPEGHWTVQWGREEPCLSAVLNMPATTPFSNPTLELQPFGSHHLPSYGKSKIHHIPSKLQHQCFRQNQKVTIITLYKTNLSLLCFSASTGSRMNTACSLSQQNRNWSPVKTPGYEASRSNVFLETSALERGTVSV